MTSRIPRLIAALLLLLAAIAAVAQDRPRFSVGSITVGGGEKRSGVLRVPERADAGVEIPITVVNGAADGPVLALIAGTHGYEYPPITALQRVRQAIDPGKLVGTVILVHIANPPSFFGRTIYYSPTDGKNLNRVYPGHPDGTQSERIAHAITTEVIERADYVVDLHGGDGNEALRPFVYMPQTGDAELDAGSRELALAFGLDHIVIDTAPLRDPDDSLYTDQTALTRGIPAITAETGQLGSNDERWVAMAESGVWNLLRHFDMYPGEAKSDGNVVWLTDYTVITSPETGIFRAEVRDGYVVAENGRIGTLVDAYGDEIAVLRAPFSGVVNYVIATPPVSKGEPVAMVSRIAID